MDGEGFDERGVFHALDDVVRRGMLTRLSLGPATVSELAPPRLTLAATVQHVQVLERCGLVVTEKRGRTRVCRLEPRTLRLAEEWLASRRAPTQRRVARLEHHLTGRKDAP